jgi:hypothetical protein
MSIECTNCGCEFDEDDIRWYGDAPYCEDCFSDRYTYCYRCDEPVNRDYCHYDSTGEPICDDCYENEVDYNAPDNPEINDVEREQIINLSKCWLKGEKPKSLIRINRHDFYLKEIQEGSGLVDLSLYLYGLIDRDEYQLRVSPNIFNRISQYVSLNNWDVKLYEDKGHNRLGISKALREEKKEEIIQLIKSIATYEMAETE